VAKRLFDIFASVCALVLLSPVLFVAAVGIKLSSPGPVIYQARRIGLKAREFTMHKFRTMHHLPAVTGSPITALADKRLFPFGALLRKLKIDELPQLYDIFVGQMSIVGPRPEDLEIVAKHFTPLQMESLTVRPGLASPGSLFNYTHGHHYISDDDPEGSYIRAFLPIKLALEIVYVRNRSLLYDLCITFRTVLTVLCILFGKREFSDPPEMEAAKQLLGHEGSGTKAGLRPGNARGRPQRSFTTRSPGSGT
jgi:lipopolysaccharide/colanic/teichoic acid biosynthesis glycosyltransferase